MSLSRFTTNQRRRGPGRGARRGIVLLAVAALLAASVATLGAPGTAWGRPVPPPGGNAGAPTSLGTGVPQVSSQSPAPPGSDPLRTLGGGSPWCDNAAQLGAQAQQNCRISGTIAAPHPVQDYGIDVPSFSLTHIADIIEAAIQGPIAWLWMAWTWAVHGVLSLLQWAFSLDLLNRAMSTVANGLGVLHNNIFGTPWMLASLSVLGLWGIWNGLVRRKTIETLGGLATAVALMIAALVLIAKPMQTVGQFSKDMDQASLAALSAGARGSIDVQQPATKFVQTEGDLYNALVLRPWCALEFANVNYCLKRHDGTTVADIWLTFGPNSVERQGLYNLTTSGSLQGPSEGELTHIENAGIDVWNFFTGQSVQRQGTPNVMNQCHTDFPSGRQCSVLAAAPKVIKKNPGAVAIQTFGDTFTRVAIFILVSVGLLGAVLVLAYLGLKLLMAAIKALLLTLAAPVILFLPAFGEAGRAAFIAWAKRLLGALISKFVFAVMLALVVLVSGIINSLPFSWLSVWMLNIIFWWGIWFERKSFVGFLTLDKRAVEGGLGAVGHGAPFRLANVYFGMRMARDLGRGVKGATALPRSASRRLRRGGLERRMADSVALREGTQSEADLRGRRAMGIKKAEDDAGARATIAAQDRRQTRLAKLRTERAAIQQRIDQYRAKPDGRSGRVAERLAKGKLGDKEAEIAAVEADMSKARPDVIKAQSTLGRVDDSDDPRALERYHEQRRRDLKADAFPNEDSEDFDRSLRAAGINASEFRKTKKEWSELGDPDKSRSPDLWWEKTRRENWLNESRRKARDTWDRERKVYGRIGNGHEQAPLNRRNRSEGWKESDRVARAAGAGTNWRRKPYSRDRIRSAEERDRFKFERRLAKLAGSRRGLR